MAHASTPKRWIPLAALSLASVLGALGMWWLTPGTGPDPVAPPPQVAPPRPIAAASTPSPAPVFRPAPSPQPVAAAPSRIKQVAKAPPVDPDKVYEGGKLRGLAQAAMDRTPAVQDCYRDWTESNNELPGRFTLNLTVSAYGNTVAATLPYAIANGDDLEDCVNNALGDAQFSEPEEDFTMIWPVPTSLRTPLQSAQ